MDKKLGAINVDKIITPAVDKLWDLNERPWPWPDGSVEIVYALDILEHLDDLVAAMEEIHRVLAPGGKLIVKAPDGAGDNLWLDPTHKRGFTPRTFDFFDPNTFLGERYGYYSRAKFKLMARAKEGDDLIFELVKQG